MKRYVIIGNGTAGASAIAEIRARDKEGSIVVFTRENHPYYYRPRLPEYIAGETGREKLAMHTLSQYEKWNVDLRLGETVTAIDPVKKEVLSSRPGGESGAARYDELLLAAGSSGFLPPVEGSGKAGVFTLRTIADADAIMAAAGKAGTKTAVLVGGGLLGLEAGRALIALGLKVEVVEHSPRLLSRQLDDESAGLLQKKLEGMGFSFRLAANVRAITGGDAATGIALADGTGMDCGLVLFSAGVRPNLELAGRAGLDVGKAVKVDRHMGTGVPGIWAAGDVAEFDGQPCGVWPVAMAQGKTAGASMAGELREYVPQTPGMTLKVAGIDLVSAGNIAAGDTQDRALTVKRFAAGNVYRKIVLEEDVIKGVIFLGSTAGARECVAAMNRGLRLGPLAQGLDREGFDFSGLSLA
ncbi:MAG: FAD-dependent oxidoreductase [Treponema sp.]|nr:FAD-dependent oxidoreductase [Treponema sp.]